MSSKGRLEGLTEHFEASRGHLHAVAYRILGSGAEAEDAVQEAWFRLARSDAEQVDNLRAWLTTVVARVCLDLLRRRKASREQPLEGDMPELASAPGDDPEQNQIVADLMGPALLLLLDRLAPAERVAFVMHDVFDIAFNDIAAVIGQSVAATRQLASRARRRISGAERLQKDRGRQQALVAAFLQASREGNLTALLQLLHPEAVLRADEAAIRMTEANKARGAPQFARAIAGAELVANTLKGKAQAAQLASIDGLAGAAWWAPNGKPVVAFCFTVEGDAIVAIDVVMDKRALNALTIEVLN